MIKGYFGVPGCGKTSLLVQTAIKEQKRLIKPYDHIYTINFKCAGCKEINWEDLAKYKMYNSLILIDEISTCADNREFKTFSKEHRDFFIMHRHLGNDIIWATQNYEKVDKTIRELTQELWYMSKSIIPLLSEITRARRIYRNININEHTSELTLGYRFCNMLEGFLAKNNKFVYRRPLYKYFDSFDELMIAEREIIYEVQTEKIPRKSSLYINKKIKEKIWKKKQKI